MKPPSSKAEMIAYFIAYSPYGFDGNSCQASEGSCGSPYAPNAPCCKQTALRDFDVKVVPAMSLMQSSTGGSARADSRARPDDELGDRTHWLALALVLVSLYRPATEVVT
jgi:hypothetical protein